MQKIFIEVGSLDERCYKDFSLSEDILMEHAANGMANYIRCKFSKNSTVIVACGSGNNGADGIALARLLHTDYDVSIFYVKKPKSPMAILQLERAHAIGVKTTIELNECDLFVDALYGTGFDGTFNYEESAVMNTINEIDAYKIACDIPSGLKRNGEHDKDIFVADITLTMGALKRGMFLDDVKDKIGEIQVIDLGVSRSIYEGDTNWHLLDLEDLKLPNRAIKDAHKGTYGHLALACGNKRGASILSAKAALRFGVGLVTLVGYENETIPDTIMYSHTLPKATTALACGMGLGYEFSDKEMHQFLDNDLPLIADADIFHMPIVLEILKRDKVVLTPHAKEFVALLKRTGLADITVEVLQKNRFKYVEKFCEYYPNVVLVLKGANVILACGNCYYINPHGTSILAKGGSGDVLSGLIGSLLGQGYTPLEAAISGSLAHTKLALLYKGADFSLTPDDLINEICNL